MNSKWKNPIRPALCASLFWFVGAGVIHAQVPAPMFKPAAAGFGSMTYVTLTDTGASSIYYTTDGSVPTASSNLYSAPILVGRSLVLNAVGYSGSSASTVTTGTYNVYGSIGVGNSYVLALEFNDTVYGWGANGSGQLGNNATATSQDTSVLMGGTTGFTNVASVAAGSISSAMLKWDGSVWTCGDNSEGELGNNTLTNEHLPVEVKVPTTGSPSLMGIGAIECGTEFCVAVSATDGTVYAWGLNANAQCGQGEVTNTILERANRVLTSTSGPTYLGPASSGSVTQINCGDSSSVALTTGSTVWVWGGNGYGQMALPLSTVYKAVAIQVSGLPAVWSVGGGGKSVFAITGSNTVLAWGENSGGQLALGNRTSPITTPTQVLASAGVALRNIVQANSSDTHSLFLSGSGTVWASGSNNYGELGNGTESSTPSSYPVQVMLTSTTPLTNIVEVGAGDSFSVALSSNGTIYTWGYNGSGNLCNGTTTSGSSGYYATTNTTLPGLIDVPPSISSFVGTVTTSEPATISLAATATAPSGNLASLSLYSGSGALLTSTSASSVGWSIPSVTSGTYSYTAVAEDAVGNLGEATIPVTVPLPTVYIESYYAQPITEGQTADFYLVRSSSDPGTLPITVNFNISGTAVEGVRFQPMPRSATIVSGSSEVAVPLVTNTDNIVEGVQSVILTGTTGAYNFATGYNLEEIDIQDPPGPVVTITPDGYSAVSSTTAVVISCTNSAAVIHYKWGGAAPTTSDPIIVSGSSVRPLSSGTLTAGAWVTGSPVPMTTAVFNFTGAVAGGVDHSLAIRSDGSVWAWGLNTSGQLGDGTYNNRYSPVQVMTSSSTTLTNIVQVVAGNASSMALDATGKVYTWGAQGTSGTTFATISGSGVILIALSDHDQPMTSSSALTGYIAAGYSPDSTSPYELWAQTSGTSQYIYGLGVNDEGQLAVYSAPHGGYGYLPMSPVPNWTISQMDQYSEVVNLPAGPVTTDEEHTASIVGGKPYRWGSGAAWPFVMGSSTNSVAIGTGMNDYLILHADSTVTQCDLLGNLTSATLSGAVGIGDGAAHSLAVLSDGSVWTWGSNPCGELGLGAAGVNETSPTQVPGFYLNYWDDPSGIGLPTWKAKQLGINPYASTTNANGFSDGTQVASGILGETYYNYGTPNAVVSSGYNPFALLSTPGLASNPSETTAPTIYLSAPVGGTLH
jgi:alpha-tubulin suppressor-like RCC1 family protein